ncbi:hypothetical protein J4218_06730 [Candidatus Pacearchaeota archaeon]|nr:hypothetical protein [Candidatus Pacearchaeota archaeon]
MTNYNNFNTRNYQCSNCSSGLEYRTIDSGFHGSYDEKMDKNNSEKFPKMEYGY